MARTISLSISHAADAGIAISTGAMLGGGRDARSFYISYDNGTNWELTYSNSPSLTAAQGKMVTARMVQAVYLNDASGTRTEDMVLADAQENTDHFCDNITPYRAHGVLCWSVGLEGGNALNQASDPNVSQGDFTPDSSNGSRSPLTQDGTAWKTGRKELAEQVIEALAAEGMICCLGLFYQQLFYWHSSQANYRAAMSTVTDWLIEKGYRNVCIDLANEAGIDPAGGWSSGTAVFNTDALVAAELDYFRGLWDGQPWRPPIGCSSRSKPGPLVLAESDVHWYHGNVSGGVPNKPTRVNEILSDTTVGPVVMNEDENVQGSTEFQAGGASRESAIEDELEAFTLVNDIVGASGGTMLATPWQRWKTDQTTKTGFLPEPGPSADTTHSDYWTAYKNLTTRWLEHVETETGGLPAL